ncbi:S-layer homology domain-containing protein [Paenibacillus algorifonticola]
MRVEGDAQGMFNPNQEVTRAEFAAILIRALGQV